VSSLAKLGPIELLFERETPKTFRFSENVAEGERGIIGTLYVLKSAFPKGTVPKSVKVTVETG